MRYLSPLRYPGGKSVLAGFLRDTIDLNDLRGCLYYEPYAGGAAAALAMLARGVASALHLNDADFRIYAFWKAVLFQSDRFVEKIFSIPLTIEEWKHQNQICTKPAGHDWFEVGFAAFYMNRCNRSGVLVGAGPIGGYAQAGKWRLDVRFNRETLAERILKLKHLRDSIQISHMDAIDFLKQSLPRGTRRKRVFVYLDPPYVDNGKRLYLNYYQERDHRILAGYFLRQRTLPWIMSYDEAPLIRKLYRQCKLSSLPVRYSLQNKRSEKELIIAPQYMAVPRSGNSCSQAGHLQTYG